MAGSSEPRLQWKNEVLEVLMGRLFEGLGGLLEGAGAAGLAAASQLRVRATGMDVNLFVAYDKLKVAEQLMSGLATSWMVQATWAVCVPPMFVAWLVSTQGGDALLMIGMVGLVISLGTGIWGMQHYIAHDADVDLLTMKCLDMIIFGVITTTTDASGWKAAGNDRYALGDCDIDRESCKEEVACMRKTLVLYQDAVSESLDKAYLVLLLSLLTLLCTFLATEVATSFAPWMFQVLVESVTCYSKSCHYLRSSHLSLRTTQQKVFEEVHRATSVTDMPKEAFAAAAIQLLQNTLHNPQSTTADYLKC
eukprot:jgi/Chlat1/8181/Chrsp76S07657